MKIKQLMFVVIAGVLLTAFSPVIAGVTVYYLYDNPSNSLNLNSGQSYSWELIHPLAPGEHVTGATITYVNVLATNYDPASQIITDLVDVPNPITNYVGTFVPTGQSYYYVDSCGRFHKGWETSPATYTYDLGAPSIDLLGDLESYLQNPTFSVTSIPSGNFTASNIIFTLTTETTNVVPAPGAVLLGSIGVAIIGCLRRRRIL